MHTKGIEIWVAILLGLVIPSLLILMLQDRPVQKESSSVPGTTASDESEASHIIIAILFENNEIVSMPLEEYVLGVVLAEMPADFELEALKAQAVVARTYALKRYTGGSKHKGAAVCASSSCCQGYKIADSYLKQGGKQASLEKVKAAVESTSGIVLRYDGKLIDATYFSCSGGHTEDAAAVWGSDVPYLQAVESPGEEQASHYVDTVRFTTSDFLSRLGISKKTMKTISVGKITYTEGGGVASVEICGKNFTGTELRKKLKLRSTSFYITAIGNTVTITTKGFGHRVGMSQYGADAMAVNGSTFRQILEHYYRGIELIQIDNN